MSEEFPIIDFSDIPGCESPSTNTRKKKATAAVGGVISSRTKSRISSIFSSASTAYDSDDDPFDLKSCSKNLKKVKESLVKTEELISLDTNNSPAGFDWHRLKLEAQVLASEINEDQSFDFIVKNLHLDSDDDEDQEPRKRLFSPAENKENHVPKVQEKLVNIDDQLEKAIRKPLTSLNSKQLMMMTPSKMPMRRTLMTPSKMPIRSLMTPSKVPSMKPLMTPSKGPSMKPLMTMTPKLPLKPTLTTPLMNSKITPKSKIATMQTPSSRRSLIKPNFITPIREEQTTPALSSRRAMSVIKPPSSKF